jgi:dTDP-glucose pyrophosphorylase
MSFKVCILAAGIGSRMESFTQQINKSFLPVEFKAVISQIIEKFKMISLIQSVTSAISINSSHELVED